MSIYLCFQLPDKYNIVNRLWKVLALGDTFPRGACAMNEIVSQLFNVNTHLPQQCLSGNQEYHLKFSNHHDYHSLFHAEDYK